MITGASSGLGAALVAAYARRGQRVSLIARDESRLKAVAETCYRLSGTRPQWHVCDVTEAERLGELLVMIDGEAPITTLIANAGVGGQSVLAGPHGESRKSASRTVDVNLLGVVNTLTPIIPIMASRMSGRLAIVASIAAFTPLAEAPAYAASKAAAYSYGHSLRRLLAASGIKVTVVCPGFIDTPMSRSLPYARPFLFTAEKAAERVLRAIDHGRADLVFPWPLRLAAAIHGLLPVAISDRLVTSLARSNKCPK